MSDTVFVQRHVDYLNELEKMGYKQKSFDYLIPNRAITAEEQDIIRKRIDKKGADNVDLLLGEKPGITITRNELRVLSGTADPPHDNTLWLNDAIIDLYCYICNQRYPDSTVYVHYTQFYTKLMEGGTYNYRKVGEIFNRRGRGELVDILKKRAMVIPVNLNNTHWILCFVDMHFKCLYALDSLTSSGGHSAVLENILQYLKDEFRDKKKIELNRSEWTVRPANTNSTPKQPNGYDCGVYACMFANVLTEYFDRQAKAKEFRRVDMEIFDVIRASDMPRVRQQIQLDLLSGKVYSRPPD